jgi:hypothetical protein
MNKNICSCLAWLVISLPFLALPLQATSLRYQATNLADVNTWGGLWRYCYQVSDQSFLTDFGFDIFFQMIDGYLFGDLITPTTSDTGRTSLVFNPIPRYLITVFSIRFPWSVSATHV